MRRTMNTKRCAHCSKDIPQVAQHCVFCGQKQPQQAPTEAKTMLGYSVADIMGGKAAPGPAPLAPPPGAFGGAGGPPPAAGPPGMGGPPPAMGGPPPGAPQQQPIAEARTMFLGNSPGAPPQQPMGPPGAPPLGPPPGMGGPPMGGMPMGPPGGMPMGPPGGMPMGPPGGMPMGPPGGMPMGPPGGMPMGHPGGMPMTPGGMPIGGPGMAPQMPGMPSGGQIAGRVAGGMVGGMVGGIPGMGGMRMPGFGGGAAVSADAVEQKYADQLKRWCFTFAALGVLWFVGETVLNDGNVVDNLKGIIHMPIALMLFFIAVPVLGLILALVGWLPVGGVVRGTMHLITGLTIIGLLLAQPSGEGGAQAMLGAGWVRYVILAGFVFTGAGHFVRSHGSEADNLAARILCGLGGALLLAAFLVPSHGQVPLVNMLKFLGKANAEGKIVIILTLLLVIMALISILSVFIVGLAKMSVVIAYGVTFWWAITLGLTIALDVFSSRWVGTWKGRLRVVITGTAPSIICIGAAAFGMAYFIHKLTADPQQQR
jgi:hypothetical protein